MRRHKKLMMVVVLIVIATPVLVLGGQRFAVPVDPQMGDHLLAAARAAHQEGNYTAALHDYRRWLELYPNEPLMQAPVYLAMGAAADKSGDPGQAKQFNLAAQSLDPMVKEHVEKAAPAATTRGKADTAFAIIAGVMGAIQQARAAQSQQMQYAPAQQAYAPPAQAGGYGYPAAPVGNPGYAAPANGYAPMPGYGSPDPNANGGAPNNGYGQPQAYGQPQPYAQQPAYGQPAQAPYGAQQSAPYGYAPPAAPYGAPPNYNANGGVTRGGPAPKPLKVIHDHSQLGDKNYFEKGCGALLEVNGGNLTFTPGGREAPQVIPAAEIREIRLNTTVGRNIGAFHIATKKGLYLNLAPSTGIRDDGRADVDSLRKELGLSD